MMSDTNALLEIVRSLLYQSPILLISAVGFAVACFNRRRAPAASAWALAGFGLSLAVSVAVPVFQVLVRQMMKNGGNATGLYQVTNFVWSVLRALSYGFLLMAVYVGRPKLTSPPPSRSGN